MSSNLRRQLHLLSLLHWTMDKPKSYHNLATANRLDHEIHPMHNELILNKIFEYSSVNSLKNCRLVSTKWRDLSLISWRRKAVLLVNAVVSDVRDAEHLLQDGSILREVPFERYRLSCAPLSYSGDQLKEKFLDTFGSSIQYIHLSSAGVGTMFSLLTKLPALRAAALEFDVQDFLSSYKRIIFFDFENRGCPFERLQPATSTLRKLDLMLTIQLMDFRTYFQSERFPWKKVFEKVPTIESLRVKYKLVKGERYTYRDRRSDLDITSLEDIMRPVCEIRKEGNLSTLNLEELDIVDTQQRRHPLRTCLTEKVAEYLIESYFPLQTLSITLNTSATVNSSTILKLLKTYADALQSLRCIGDPSGKHYEGKKNVRNLSMPLPPYLPSKVALPNLKEIVFVTSCVWAFHVLTSLEVPNLESLRIEPNTRFYYTEAYQQHFYLHSHNTVFISGASLLPNLKRFFYDGPRSFTLTELECLGEAMPNIIDLGISLCDIDAFPIVYELWPNLQSLRVLLSDRTYLLFDDYAITGLPVAVADYEDGMESRESNITNLKDLREFVLETRLLQDFPRPRRPLITDISAIHGFLQLPKLRILNMETLCEFSSRILDALESHVTELKLECPETVNSNDESDDVASRSDESEIEFGDCCLCTNNEEEEDTGDITSRDSDSDVEKVVSEDGEGNHSD